LEGALDSRTPSTRSRIRLSLSSRDSSTRPARCSKGPRIDEQTVQNNKGETDRGYWKGGDSDIQEGEEGVYQLEQLDEEFDASDDDQSYCSKHSVSTCSEDLEKEQSEELANSDVKFLNFSFKNLPELASYNMEILTAVMETRSEQGDPIPSNYDSVSSTPRAESEESSTPFSQQNPSETKLSRISCNVGSSQSSISPKQKISRCASDIVVAGFPRSPSCIRSTSSPQERAPSRLSENSNSTRAQSGSVFETTINEIEDLCEGSHTNILPKPFEPIKSRLQDCSVSSPNSPSKRSQGLSHGLLMLLDDEANETIANEGYNSPTLAQRMFFKAQADKRQVTLKS